MSGVLTEAKLLKRQIDRFEARGDEEMLARNRETLSALLNEHGEATFGEEYEALAAAADPDALCLDDLSDSERRQADAMAMEVLGVNGLLEAGENKREYVAEAFGEDPAEYDDPDEFVAAVQEASN